MCDNHDDVDDNDGVRYNEEDIREWFRYDCWNYNLLTLTRKERANTFS